MAKLKTERLTLRPFRRDDGEEFARLAGDWGVASMTSDIPYPLSPEQAVLWLSPVRGEIRFAIEHDGALVGGAGFYRRASGSAELGFWLGRPWWGRGFASEATREVVRCGFLRHKVPMFTSAHFVDNAASRNVLRKLGFQPAGECEITCVARGLEVRAQTYWLDRSHAQRAIAGLEKPAAAFDRLRDLVTWARRGGDKTKEPSVS